MRTTNRAQAGFTFFELMIAATVLISVLGVMASLLVSTDELSKTGHLNTRATAEHRRNLASLSRVIRTADIESLTGFDYEGRATEPVFQRVTGVDLVERTLSNPERIEWRANPSPVDGVEKPGALWLVSDTGTRLIADRIPADSFEMRQEGGVIAIRLTTYYAVDAMRVTQVTSETAVTLRN